MFEGKLKMFKKLTYLRKTRNFCDWVKSWASRKTKSRGTLKTQILKNILSIFRDWGIDPPMSSEKSLCGLATRTCDWTNPQLSHQNRATLFLKIFDIFTKTKDFPKTTKILKNLFVFDQQELSMWKHIWSSTITQMNMAFIEHKHVCCVWISKMR